MLTPVAEQRLIDEILLYRKLLDWRDDTIVEIDVHLRQALPLLKNRVGNALENATYLDLVRRRRFIDEDVKPAIEAWMQDVQCEIHAKASASLSLILRESIELRREYAQFDAEAHKGTLSDAGLVFASSAGVVISGLGFASASVVPAAGLLGLVGITSVSMPIAVAGAAITTVALALSGHQMVNLKSKTMARYRNAIDKWITTAIWDDVPGSHPSLRESLQRQVEQLTAELLNNPGEDVDNSV